MPLTEKGEKIKAALVKQHGEEKGTSILYAGKNKGTFTGIDAQPAAVTAPSAAAPLRKPTWPGRVA